MSQPPIQSPCTLVCAIDMETGWCHGCGRTRDEIGAWTLYSPERRIEVMAGLAARMEQIVRKPRRETRRTRMAREQAATTQPDADDSGTGAT